MRIPAAHLCVDRGPQYVKWAFMARLARRKAAPYM